MKKIIILGSINMDLVVSAFRAPEGGETLVGCDFQMIPGGKGANQAVAIARQGRIVEMIARVGNDGFGEDLINQLEKNHVQVNKIKSELGCPTGIAIIIVEKTGQNRIIIIPGANGHLSAEDVDEAKEVFSDCDFLVMQLEVPLHTVEYATRLAKSFGVKTVLNAAPAPEIPLDRSLLSLVDYLIVNEIEAEVLSKKPIKALEDAKDAAKQLNNETKGSIIITLGENGTLAYDGKEIWHTPSFKITVVDTTAAGDAFIGGMVASLSRGDPLKKAIIYGNAAGAFAATKFGAQPSLPTKAEIDKFLLKNDPVY